MKDQPSYKDDNNTGTGTSYLLLLYRTETSGFATIAFVLWLLFSLSLLSLFKIMDGRLCQARGARNETEIPLQMS
jgi:hypothetical protein